eukprot:m51a1_g6513 hypothetical protein (544) ;mRNA; r:257098-259109
MENTKESWAFRGKKKKGDVGVEDVVVKRGGLYVDPELPHVLVVCVLDIVPCESKRRAIVYAALKLGDGDWTVRTIAGSRLKPHAASSGDLLGTADKETIQRLAQKSPKESIRRLRMPWENACAAAQLPGPAPPDAPAHLSPAPSAPLTSVPAEPGQPDPHPERAPPPAPSTPQPPVPNPHDRGSEPSTPKPSFVLKAHTVCKSSADSLRSHSTHVLECTPPEPRPLPMPSTFSTSKSSAALDLRSHAAHAPEPMLSQPRSLATPSPLDALCKAFDFRAPEPFPSATPSTAKPAEPMDNGPRADEAASATGSTIAEQQRGAEAAAPAPDPAAFSDEALQAALATALQHGSTVLDTVFLRLSQFVGKLEQEHQNSRKTLTMARRTFDKLSALLGMPPLKRHRGPATSSASGISDVDAKSNALAISSIDPDDFATWSQADVEHLVAQRYCSPRSVVRVPAVREFLHANPQMGLGGQELLALRSSVDLLQLFAAVAESGGHQMPVGLEFQAAAFWRVVSGLQLRAAAKRATSSLSDRPPSPPGPPAE